MSIITGKPEYSRRIPDADYYEANPEGMDVFSWSPEPAGTLSPKSTQVHLHFLVAGGIRFIMRFKSPRTLDRLINALITHREDVWGPR